MGEAIPCTRVYGRSNHGNVHDVDVQRCIVGVSGVYDTCSYSLENL